MEPLALSIKLEELIMEILLLLKKYSKMIDIKIENRLY